MIALAHREADLFEIARGSAATTFDCTLAVWRDNSEAGRVELVKKYVQSLPGLSTPKVVATQSAVPGFLQMLGLAGGDPFYAVIAEKMAVLTTKA